MVFGTSHRSLACKLPVRKSRLVLAPGRALALLKFIDVVGVCDKSNAFNAIKRLSNAKSHLHDIFSRFHWLRRWPRGKYRLEPAQQIERFEACCDGVPVGLPRSDFQSPSRIMPSSTISPFLALLQRTDGGFLKWEFPQIIHINNVNRIFHYKPST